MKEIRIDGVDYVACDKLAPKLESMPYVIVRTYSAGVFAGYLEKREGQEVVLRNSRRLWSWAGAASLSQLAMEGTKNPSDCKFAMEVSKEELLQVIEILTCTETAFKSIKEVSIWKI